MLKFIGGTIGIIFLIGLLVVIGILMLIFWSACGCGESRIRRRVPGTAERRRHL